MRTLAKPGDERKAIADNVMRILIDKLQSYEMLSKTRGTNTYFSKSKPAKNTKETKAEATRTIRQAKLPFGIRTEPLG